VKGTLAVSTMLLVLAGCASVDVVRVNDKNRDSVKGFRYYLPRPYVVVKNAYPVAGADYLVPAIVQQDGRFQVEEKFLSPDIKAQLEEAGISLAFSRDEIRVSPDMIGQPTTSVDVAAAAQQQSSTPSSSSSPAATAPSSVANDAMMAGSKAEPTTLTKDLKTFLVTAKVTKNSTAASIQISDPGAVVVGLVPIDAEGNPKASAFIALESLPSSSTPWKADADGSYVATGSRELLPGPGPYAIALKFSGTVAQVTGTPLILHQATPTFSVLGPTGKPKAPADAKKPEKAPDSSGQAEVGSTKALLATSGDPDTDPFTKLDNGFFDILYLPDLEEQYAINVNGGLGTAGMQLGLESGWMLERATAEVDNKELGKFIFRNIDKFTDIGALALKAAINPVLAGIPAGSEAAQQSRTPGNRATLRITYSLEAQPGLYPILKMSEVSARSSNSGSRASSDRFLYLASLPDTRVSYNVKRTLTVQLVSLGSPAGKPGVAAAAGCADGTTDLTPTILTALASELIPGILKSSQRLDDAGVSDTLKAVTGYGRRGTSLVLCVSSTNQNKLDKLKALATVSPLPNSITDLGIDRIELVVK
jgi:hypothetical protein